MKAPSFNWKFKTLFLAGVFLAGTFVGQLPYRDVMQADDSNLVSAYWLLSKVKMSGVAASIRQSNLLKFEANGWKQLDGGLQIASAPKP